MTRHLDLTLTSPEQTSALAARLGAMLHAGDVLLLSGEIGAGKTHFARALIQSLQDTPEDVPSPTFTLVQVYDTPAGELWHADLYRLSSPDECVELGLADAFDEAICLVEWPDKLEDLTPAAALSLRLADRAGDDTRQLTLTWTDPRWDSLVAALV
ncbi:tRNA (adenosine(37)-N6)-threonylcarbamoyltransferase complex ATPase subunit type 1 TsaE [Tropicibacter naphthalenivorans]|uniref:tRNA threonylcarbamoyladenosine biosynthesis protein TsaE n=1 Tax=Tropicibacter naphthalenivorans TaxID=441103 RepID=A0A0P1GDQ1_9RHOB|nr:tRNA (adenosine(37)-N6)-threonylcarbamoyltransferase complex ATPase subunit type 1 TsaE [Tropicibacter naphthalenivorans]CUH79531.1 ADP-binding protein [Tropicibacter naphthalenivorans]SMC73359.1 tRNA threonylcarbamoyladenosine biosynthesis protein TsaE [Tropicibacter naphthalenivorans]